MKLDYRAVEGTNTKVRRLAYLTAIVNILGRSGLSERAILARLVRWGQQSKTWLKDYWVQTGEVTSTHRNSAGGRYLHLATNLGLVASISGVYRDTRVGLVLWELARGQNTSLNPFYLTKAEQLFFAYLLLERDADILLTVTDYLLEHPDSPLAQIQRHFQSRLVERLNSKIRISQDERLKQRLLDRRTVIQEWEKPERYAEHIVPPRLNWLLDLEALEPGGFRRHRYFMTEGGIKFLAAVPRFGDEQFCDVTSEWLQTGFWTAVGALLNLDPLPNWDLPDDQIHQLLAEAFKQFQYTAVPKVSLTQILLYLSVKLMLEHQIRASPITLREWLETEPVWKERQYKVRFSPRENESYLVAVSS